MLENRYEQEKNREQPLHDSENIITAATHMSSKTNVNDNKSVNWPSRSNNKSRSVSKKSTDRTMSSEKNLQDSVHKYQFYSLHEELTFLRNERVNFQHRSQLQYAEIKRLKQELKAKVHELWDCKEKLKAYEIEEQIKESNSASNGNNRTVEKSKSDVKGQNDMVNYCVTKSEKIPSRETDKLKSPHDVNSQSHEVLEEQQEKSEQLKCDEATNKNSSNNSTTTTTKSYRSAFHVDNKIINELRRNLAQRDSALHDLQLRSIELDTARGKLAREVERLQQELMNVSEERNTLNNKLLDKDREIDKINKELCASKEHIIEQTREVERLLVRNKTYELLLHDKDDLCFAVSNTTNENELWETDESKQENELCYRNECKVFNDTPTALYAKRLPSQFTSSGSHKATSTEESKIIHSVLHSQSLMFKQRIREIQMELFSVKESEERVQHEMRSTQNELDKCNKELMELREECQRIRDECVFHKEEVALLQNKIETMNMENNNNYSDDNCKNKNITKESYVALMRLNRRLQRKLDKLQIVQEHDGQTDTTNLKSKEDNVNTNDQVDEWENKCNALQRTNDELESDNRILARAAELLCASHTQKVNTLSTPPSECTAQLQHKLQSAQQAVADLQEKLNVATRENVEYEMLITKIADIIPIHALLSK